MGTTWKEQLAGEMPAELAREIDIFETEIALRKVGKVEERLFAETRLRRGVYGQRYDNGERHDGTETKNIPFPSGVLTKGPNTMWDAPGMMRIKIPFGGVTAKQLEVMADLAEEYSDAILHVTTRQDIQLHYVHIEDTPDLMRRLAAVNITTREACGNGVRNVTACPRSGVCKTEAFDVTPYSKALAMFLLGHPDTMEFGRKFKPAFSGCAHEACGLTSIHDLGGIAVTRPGADGKEQRGFQLYVGGGLGAVPYAAKLFDEFLPEEELLPLAQAISRVFGRLGEKRNRQRARIKFLVAKLGLEEFKRMVLEERAKLPHDPRWTEFLSRLHETDEIALKRPSQLELKSYPPGFDAWLRTNVYRQRQAGYALATVTCPLGDLTSDQTRKLADLARKYSGDNIRLTVEQNIVLRWISEADLPDLYKGLVAIGLGESGASTITDVTSCPGTDTCKLGISSSRGLAGELRKQLTVIRDQLDPAVQKLHVKASGCFNSCGQHHVADLGFLGVSRNVNGRRVPHFQVVLGGQWTENAASVGLAIGAVPSKYIPEVVKRMTDTYVKERTGEESFQDFIKRIGKARVRDIFKDLLEIPSYDAAPELYRDWGDPREYTIGDMGQGECAGEVVPFVEFGLAASEREVFEAQIILDAGDAANAAKRAHSAMLQAAKALVRARNQDIADDANQVISEFRTYFHDTKLFHDTYAGDKFAAMLFAVHEKPLIAPTTEQAHHLIEEAQLFIDAAHACYARMGSATATAGAPAAAAAPEKV